MSGHQASASRLEAGLKVTGSARYEGDANVSGLLHAALVTASIPNGRVQEILTSAAEAIPGVFAVLTHETVPKLRPGAFRLALQDPIIHFAGQPVAVVLAETLLQAKLGATAVQVRYVAAPAITSVEQAMDSVYSAKTAAGGVPVDSQRGDLNAGLTQADVVLRRRYTTPTHNHHPIEPHVVIASWEGDELTVHTTSQCVFAHRDAIAQCFALPPDQVRVISTYLGGGFGSKGAAWRPELMLGILAARVAGQPVRLELSRAQMFTLVGRRPQSVQHVTLGATRAGQLTAIAHHSLGETSTYGDYADPNAALARWLYACPNVETSHRSVRLNVPQSNPMRAPGEGTGSFALESAMDELAHDLNIDPVALRLANFAAHDPHADRPWSSNALIECYRVAADAFGWAERPPGLSARRDCHRLIGWGMASAAYPVHRLAAEALVRVNADGRVSVHCGTQDIGTGAYTVLAQLAATALGVAPQGIHVILGDTRLPYGPPSAGSMATASFAPAVESAAANLRQMILALAAADPHGPWRRHSIDDLTLHEGQIRSRVSDQSEALSDLLTRAAPQGLEATASTEAEVATSYSANAYGAVFAEVSVDKDLGEVRVTRLTAAYAAGRILNQRLTLSQYVGGMVGGIGMALHEATVMDEGLGRIIGDTLVDYLLPVHADMPRFDVHLVEEQDHHLPSGVKGVGMIGTVGTAAAIANAIFNATGKRVRDLPIRMEALL